MSQNSSYNMNEDPLRGFAFVQFSNSLNNMRDHFGDDVEIVCMSVQFPTLCQERAQAILRRSLQACLEIVNCGIDLRYYTFQMFECRTKFPTGIFRIIFFVPGSTVCTGMRLCDDLKSKLKRYGGGHPFRIALNPPGEDEYEGSLVFSPDNPQLAHSWLADCLQDARACSYRHSCCQQEPMSAQYRCSPVW